MQYCHKKNILIVFTTFIFFICGGTSDVIGEEVNYIGDVQIYGAKYEDTFIDIARRHKLGFVEIRAANPGIDPWIPGKGTKIMIPSRHLFPEAPRKGIVINLPEMRLYLFDQNGAPLKTYPIGIGRDGLNTPEGTTSIVHKAIGPTWRPTPRMRKESPDLPAAIKPGPDNPLGTHALYLGWPAYALHGTNRPYGIGRRVSSGCIRLYPEDIIKLYEHVEVGIPVTVVNQPIKATWIDDQFFLEAHPTVEQANEVENDGELTEQSFSAKEKKMIIKAAGKRADFIDWDIVHAVIKERRGIPVIVSKPQTL